MSRCGVSVEDVEGIGGRQRGETIVGSKEIKKIKIEKIKTSHTKVIVSAVTINIEKRGHHSLTQSFHYIYSI